MITVHDIHKTYGSKTVLRGVDASFPPRQLTALIGPNGAGKTTLLMMIARLMEPTAGEVRIEGRGVAGIAIGDYARRVATLRQSPDFNLRLRVEELVAFGRFPYSRGVLTGEDQRIIDEAIAFLSLQALRHAYLDELSGGEFQKVLLARALVQEPRVLLLDEPTSSLDLKNQLDMLATLQRVVRGHNVAALLSLHDLNTAFRFADRLLFLKEGVIRGSCAPSDAPEALVREVYGVPVDIVSHKGIPMIVPS